MNTDTFWDYITCVRLLMLFVSSSLVSLVAVVFCLLASMVVHGFRSVLLSVLLYAFSSWLLIGASFGFQMASYGLSPVISQKRTSVLKNP